MDPTPSTSAPVDHQRSECLLRQAQGGDQRALSDLLQRYGDRVIRMARIRMGRQLSSKIEPEDIAQMTLQRAWQSLGQFDPRQARHLIDWLAVIAENCIRDEVKRWNADKRSVKNEVTLEVLKPQDGSSTSIPLSANDGTPSQYASVQERREIYDRCLSELPERYREIVLLRQYADMSWDEIAVKLNSPSAKAAVQMHIRAMDALRLKLETAGFEPPSR